MMLVASPLQSAVCALNSPLNRIRRCSTSPRNIHLLAASQSSLRSSTEMDNRIRSIAGILNFGVRSSQPKTTDRNPLQLHLANLRQRTERFTTEFEDNRTIARRNFENENGMHGHFGDILGSSDEDNMESVCKRVCDHAHRRMQILYYQLVVYHKEGCEVRKGKNKLQHGVSHCPKCAASHSAIIPKVKDNYFKLLVSEIENKRAKILSSQSKEKDQNSGLDDKIIRRLIAFGVTQERLAEYRKRFDSGIEMSGREFLSRLGIEIKTGLIGKGCHLRETAGSTVELPKIVNEYDCLIEDTMRPAAVAILNAVSKGELTPYQGLKRFELEMQSFLTKSSDATQLAISLVKQKQILEEKLYEFERRTDRIGNWLREYLDTVYDLCEVNLKIDEIPKDRVLVSLNSSWPVERDQLYTRIINCMLTDYHYVKDIQDLRSLKAYVYNECSKIQDPSVKQEVLASLNDISDDESFMKAKETFLSWLESLNPSAALIKKRGTSSKLKEDIDAERSTFPMHSPSKYSGQLKRLSDSLKVIDWQAKGSEAPQEKDLEAVLCGRKQLSDEDRKIELITRRMEF